jgi:hypothetical protein
VIVADDEQDADEATTVDRTAAERLATAAERAPVASRLEHRKGEGIAANDEAADAAELVETAEIADTTDMNAVGDDGQVFGG